MAILRCLSNVIKANKKLLKSKERRMLNVYPLPFHKSCKQLYVVRVPLIRNNKKSDVRMKLKYVCKLPNIERKEIGCMVQLRSTSTTKHLLDYEGGSCDTNTRYLNSCFKDPCTKNYLLKQGVCYEIPNRHSKIYANYITAYSALSSSNHNYFRRQLNYYMLFLTKSLFDTCSLQVLRVAYAFEMMPYNTTECTNSQLHYINANKVKTRLCTWGFI